MIIVIMGVAGSGKTTIGRALAQRLGAEFLEGDRFHAEANVTKMSSGVPLTDDDRAPWLEGLREAIAARAAEGRDAVVACSALKQGYRDVLSRGITPPIHWIFLKIDSETATRRLQDRSGHFMPAHLVASQFSALEEPSQALTIDATQPVAEIIAAIVDSLKPVE